MLFLKRFLGMIVMRIVRDDDLLLSIFWDILGYFIIDYTDMPSNSYQ